MNPEPNPERPCAYAEKDFQLFKAMGNGNGDLVVNISVYVPKSSAVRKGNPNPLRPSDNFKGDASTKKSIFDKFKNYFS